MPPPLAHAVTIIRTPISVMARCECGWQHSQTRRQNALARQAKLEAAVRMHEQAVAATAKMEER